MSDATLVSGGTLAVDLKNISKSFYGVRANDSVDFDLRWGEVHTLLGENGAGKSTLCSVLAGLYRPDSGSFRYDGHPQVFKSPKDALSTPQHSDSIRDFFHLVQLVRDKDHRSSLCRHLAHGLEQLISFWWGQY